MIGNSDKLYIKMVEYFSADPKRIQHFIKVNSLATLIGRAEGLGDKELEVLSAAAYVHDIGIKRAEELYGRCDGALQEQLGQEPARQILTECGFEEAVINRVVYLVAHHHTYSNIDGLDYQALVEADFLVNIYEDGLSRDAALNALNKIFKTKTGERLLVSMFGLN
jgi:HD superfamily phosphodiesterase